MQCKSSYLRDFIITHKYVKYTVLWTLHTYLSIKRVKKIVTRLRYNCYWITLVFVFTINRLPKNTSQMSI